MKRFNGLRFVFLFSLIFAACTTPAATPERTDTLYFVESKNFDFHLYHVESGYVGSVDGCNTGFSLPRVASHEVILDSADGQLKIIIDESLNARIEIPSGVIDEISWKTVWNEGIIERNKQLTINFRNGEESKYISVANCLLELMSSE